MSKVHRKTPFRICTDEAIVERQTRRQDRGKHLFRPRSGTYLFAFSRVFIKQGEGGILREEQPPSDPPSTLPRSSSLAHFGFVECTSLLFRTCKLNERGEQGKLAIVSTRQLPSENKHQNIASTKASRREWRAGHVYPARTAAEPACKRCREWLGRTSLDGTPQWIGPGKPR